MKDLQVLVVDDDASSRNRLISLVETTDTLSLDAACTEGRAAIEHILRDAPDLVFLDVQMPEVTGLDVVRTIGPHRMPPFIFVTAHDQYALAAFEVDAVDYLLKPFDDDRFTKAVTRAKEYIRYRSLSALSDRMLDVLQANGSAQPSADTGPPREPHNGDATAVARTPTPNGPSPSPLYRIAVQRRGTIELVPVEAIRFFEADGSYVKVHTADRTYLIRERMKDLDARLPIHHFCRIHRSTIVRLADVKALEPTSQGDLVARLHDGTRLRVSRGRRDALETRLGL